MATLRVKFYLESRNDKKGKPIKKNVPIMFSVSYGGRYYSSTGIRVDFDQWNGKAVKSHPRAEILNRELRDIRERFEKLYDQAIITRTPLDINYFKYNYRRSQKNEGTFTELFDEFIEQGKKQWQPGTVKRVTVVQNHLTTFAKQKKVKLSLDLIDVHFFEKLMDYYFGEKDYINTYVRKNIKVLKQFLSWAAAKGCNVNPAYRTWDLRTGQKKESSEGNIVALTPLEFFNILELKIENEATARIRDFLIFSCATGFRYSDIANLKKSDIDYKAGVINCTTIKTGDNTQIPFNELSQEILERYQHTPNYNKAGIDMAIPTITNQKTNKALKKLGEDAGLTDLIPIVHYKRNLRVDATIRKCDLLTCHVGRKTFVSLNIWLGVKSEVLMGLTTHKDHKTMERYYSINMEQKRAAMNGFNIGSLKNLAKQGAELVN